MAYPRYAIYYTPRPGSDFDRFGAELLGCDAATGEDLPFPDGILQLAPDWRELTRDPRKYGFHATLKAPLSLAPGKTEADLLAACEAFAKTPRPIPLISPVVGSISGFIAVVPGGAIGRTRAARRGLRPRIRFVSRAAYRRRSCPAKSVDADAKTARLSRSLGISLCHARLPLSYDADGPSCRRSVTNRSWRC